MGGVLACSYRQVVARVPFRQMLRSSALRAAIFVAAAPLLVIVASLTIAVVAFVAVVFGALALVAVVVLAVAPLAVPALAVVLGDLALVAASAVGGLALAIFPHRRTSPTTPRAVVSH